MTKWINPKTNWTGSKDEYFNLDPDYNRIKGNIEYVAELANLLYRDFNIPTLETPHFLDIPKVSFFNKTSEAITTIQEHTFEPEGYEALRHYSPNGTVWDWIELNKMENNLLLMQETLQRQKDNRRRLSFKLGGKF